MTVSRSPQQQCCRNPKLGYYQLGKALGAGNYGVVRLAIHCITGTKVAMKIIDKTKLCQRDQQRLFREVQIMKLLDHPNIIRFYQVVENYQYLHLVSSYAENGELFEHVMESGSLSETDAAKYFHEICGAIKYCHDKGVVHRDLKIENVLLDCNNNVRIADFGFSNYFKPPRLLETYCGSPQYAAPEIFIGKHYDGFKADVWSLGIILYVMVTGGLPFGGQSIAEIKQNVLRGKFRIPYFVSHECEHLVRSMLCLEPEKRPDMDTILSHSWITSNINLTKESPKDAGSTSLNNDILTLMENIGISKSRVIESYNSYLFNDFTAIYKLLSDQLRTKGFIDTRPIKAWLRQEGKLKSPSEGPPASPRHPTPAHHHQTKPVHKKSGNSKQSGFHLPNSGGARNSKQGLDKVLHNAKNRALSAICSKTGTVTSSMNNEASSPDNPQPGGATKPKGKLKELKCAARAASVASPLVSSLISPRTLPSQSSSNNIFHRAMFGITSGWRSSSSSQQIPHTVR